MNREDLTVGQPVIVIPLGYTVDGYQWTEEAPAAGPVTCCYRDLLPVRTP